MPSYEQFDAEGNHTGTIYDQDELYQAELELRAKMREREASSPPDKEGFEADDLWFTGKSFLYDYIIAPPLLIAFIALILFVLFVVLIFFPYLTYRIIQSILEYFISQQGTPNEKAISIVALVPASILFLFIAVLEGHWIWKRLIKGWVLVRILKNTIIGIMIIGMSLAIGGAIYYFFLPLIIHSLTK